MERTASRIAQVDHEGVPGLFDGNEALALLRLSTQTPQGRSHRTLADESGAPGRFHLGPAPDDDQSPTFRPGGSFLRPT